MFSGGNQSHPDPPGAAPSQLRPSHSAPASLHGQEYRHQDNTEYEKKIRSTIDKIKDQFRNSPL